QQRTLSLIQHTKNSSSNSSSVSNPTNVLVCKLRLEVSAKAACTSLEVIKAGPHCPTAQLIATLKNGRKICLDLQAPLYKKIVKKLLES
uniref:Chemokine interleukin-8-like domain-containing protein n=1 Tax=Papio anubis TaxID=9555 RepID=A0A8I5NHT3_PAPAN